MECNAAGALLTRAAGAGVLEPCLKASAAIAAAAIIIASTRIFMD
jgi:hypothetical protein